MRAFLLLLASVALVAPSPAPGISGILAKMAEQQRGIESYEVPVRMDVHFHKLISIHQFLTGTRYFKRPDRAALVVNAVPAEARAFQHIYEGLGTPETWPEKYVITMLPETTYNTVHVFELQGVPKKIGNVDHVVLDVAMDSYAPVRARWFYRNGGTAEMQIYEQRVQGKYLLPSTENIQINFPAYEAHGTVSYGEYKINQPIADSVFNK